MAIYSDVNLYTNIYTNDVQVYDEFSINQSIVTILGTLPGQRLFRPTFGSYLYYLLFEPMNSITANSIANASIIAIEQWETRIKLTDTSVTPDYANLSYDIALTYRIPALNNQSAVFNFKLAKLPN
jgi:phage baseplate assembly protein W